MYVGVIVETEQVASSVFFNSKWPSKTREDLKTDCEIVWAEVRLNASKKLLIGCFYRPHKKMSQGTVNGLQRYNISCTFRG